MESKSTIPLITTLTKKDTHILETLISIYSDRLLHHSDQLWTIGSVFIPLSLSGIALGFSNPIQTLFIGLFSITLIWIWYAISVNLRKLIDETYHICGSLESILLHIDPPLTKTGLEELGTAKSHGNLRTIRLCIPLVITIGWFVVITISFAA